jgi:hypothetical protein
MAHKQVNHKDQKLSKDMKKQGQVSSKKPNNSTLSSEDHLAEKPKKGTYREPNSKKIDGEKFLAKDHKLTHIKEFKRFLNESLEEYMIDGERTDGEWSQEKSDTKVRVKDIIQYLENFGLETEVIISSDYSKGNTPQEIIKSSGFIHERTDGTIVLTGI